MRTERKNPAKGRTKRATAKTARKYEFTGETQERYGRTLHRIQRLADGQVGGWIEREENLSHESTAWVSGSAAGWSAAGFAQYSGDKKGAKLLEGIGTELHYLID